MRGLALVVTALALPLAAGAASAAPPNVLVVLADDLGFSDLGCYGSEIATPNLDRLAANGVRFTQFANTAKCHSSRVSLLSGLYCRQAGDIELTRAVILPEMLGSAGYFTAMTGKWHLSREPTDFGFERFFGHLSGATDYYRGNGSFRLNGRPWTVPEQGFYTTVADVDYALEFLGEARSTRKPWFLYVAFNAPHAPLQPLEADYKKYLGRYDVGWDVIRAARAAKQRELGLFGHDVEPSPRPDHVPAWESLPPETKAWESRRMAAYAALIDRVDQELGRLFADLERAGEFANTVVLFLSDNGACPYDRRTAGRDREPYEPGVSWSDSTGWAWARNTPFRFYKQNQFEGGIATPAIVHWPAGIPAQEGTPRGRLVHTPAHLIDVLPTLAEITGTSRPVAWPGREPEPLAGVSLVPLLTGGELERRPPIHLLFGTDRGLRDGDWKLVSFRSEPWELYHIATDRTEAHDVAAEHPEIVARMAKQWTDMARDVLRCPPRDVTDVAAAATVPRRHPEWTDDSSPGASAARHSARKGKGARQRAAGRPPAGRPDAAPSAVRADEALPLVFEDTFAEGAARWEPTDAAAWTLGKDGDRAVWGLNKRQSDYQPKVRSPHNVALVKDLELSDTVISFQVKSTLDTGHHRDCCVFFNWRDPEHFYYVHLGAKPDPASGQIMIVDGAPRRALTKNTRPVPWDDRWHTVKLVRDVASGRIAVYFDDLETPLMEATDTTFRAGRVGIGSFDDMNDFTDVRIHGRRAEPKP